LSQPIALFGFNLGAVYLFVFENYYRHSFDH